MTARKRDIAGSFSGAAGQYDDAAPVQRAVAAEVVRRVLAGPLAPQPRALEIGCGTGLLSQGLLAAIPGGTWTLTDISPPMLAHCAARLADPRARFHRMDGETPDVGGPFDLIVSSLAVQWFETLGPSLARLAGLLAPGGRLVFSTLGHGTFKEWRAAHDELGLPCGVPDYPTPEALAAVFPGRVELQAVPMRYPDGMAFIRALRAIGADVPRPGHRPLPPGALRRVLRRFAGGCAVTYQVLYCDQRRDGP